jgi:hypothetical protein
MAVVVVLLGLAIVLLGIPTAEGSRTIAGALFGSGAAFIGAWVAEKNKVTSEKASEERRMRLARAYFTPELARILAQQVSILDRLMANFIVTSVGGIAPGDHPTSFLPRRPVLYPTSGQFKDLSESDAIHLIEFYDAADDIDQTINSWIEGGTYFDFNAYNVLMQSVRNSLTLGRKAAESFCPDIQFSPLMPASGTLLQRIDASIAQTKQAMDAHLKRHGAQ